MLLEAIFLTGFFFVVVADSFAVFSSAAMGLLSRLPALSLWMPRMPPISSGALFNLCKAAFAASLTLKGAEVPRNLYKKGRVRGSDLMASRLSASKASSSNTSAAATCTAAAVLRVPNNATKRGMAPAAVISTLLSALRVRANKDVVALSCSTGGGDLDSIISAAGESQQGRRCPLLLHRCALTAYLCNQDADHAGDGDIGQLLDLPLYQEKNGQSSSLREEGSREKVWG